MKKSMCKLMNGTNLTRLFIILTIFFTVSCNDQVDYRNESSKSPEDWFSQQTDLNSKTLIRNKNWGELVDWAHSRNIDKDLSEAPLFITGKTKVNVGLNSNSNNGRNNSNEVTNQIRRNIAFYKKQNGFIVSEVRFIPSKEFIVENPNGMNGIGLSSIPENYSGLLLVYDYKTSKLKGGISYEKGKATGETEILIPQKQGGRTQGCTSYSVDYYTGVGDEYWYAGTDTYWFCTVEFPSYSKPLAIEPVDDSSGLGGSSAWNPGENSSETGIDCASFNFVKTTTDAYWQECAILNIKLNVFVLDASTGRVKSKPYTISRPIWFGIPTKLASGQLIAPGQAAEMAAAAETLAHRDIANDYIDREFVIDAQIEQDFVNYVNFYLQEIAGKCDFHGSGSSLVTPQSADYLLFGNGDCY